MKTFLIIAAVILIVLCGLVGICVLIGSSKLKTEEEQCAEMEEQAKYLREHSKKKQK